jgi:hypothetical protein
MYLTQKGNAILPEGELHRIRISLPKFRGRYSKFCVVQTTLSPLFPEEVPEAARR